MFRQSFGLWQQFNDCTLEKFVYPHSLNNCTNTKSLNVCDIHEHLFGQHLIRS